MKNLVFIYFLLFLETGLLFCDPLFLFGGVSLGEIVFLLFGDVDFLVEVGEAFDTEGNRLTPNEIAFDAEK